jgi:hypothetical protein
MKIVLANTQPLAYLKGMKIKHTAVSAAQAVRSLLGDTIAKTWDEYFDGAHKANAYNAAKLVQEQVNGPLKSAPCDFRQAMMAVQDAMPELFAEYWDNQLATA